MKMFRVILLGLLVSGCTSNKKVSDPAEKTDQNKLPAQSESDTNAVEWDTFQKKVYVWIKEDSINFKNLEDQYTLTVFNNSHMPITFGKEFQVERYRDDRWNTINSQIVFPKVTYALQPGRKFDLSFSPKFDGGLGFIGNYRIKKPFIFHGGRRETGFATDDFKVFTALMPGLEQRVFLEVPESVKMSEIQNKIFYKVLNNTINSIEFGDYYAIERFDGKNWQKIRLSFFTQSIGYYLHPGTEGQQERFYFRLYPEQFRYQPGLYRIIKPYIISDENRRTKTEAGKKMVAEFRIVP